MEKREFLKMLTLGGFSLAAYPVVASEARFLRSKNNKKLKNWVWITTDVETSVDEWKKQFRVMHESGIDAIVPEVYDGRKAYYKSDRLPAGGLWLERILPLAKAEGLEVHAWMWVIPCNIEDVYTQHPEWYSVNRKRESAAEKPAYVDYYRFLCPSRPEVHEFIQAIVTELSQVEQLDGIHLDYIRYPDVILAEGIQPKYKIVQDREYPQYDYCYCEVCLSAFKRKTGIDLTKHEDPTTSVEWRQFRNDRITEIVNDKLVPLAHRFKKKLTAAVFPNWEMVRQEWSVWDLDGHLPMLYHGFYNKDIAWIREQTEKGVRSLQKRAPLYSGLFVPQLNPQQLAEAIELGLEGGAKGVALFSARNMTESHWQSFRRSVKG